MAKWRSSLLTKVMGIMQCISECRCVLYLYSSVEARLPWWFYIHACILYMYACRINFCQRYMYRSIESTTLSIPHVRSTHKHYTSTSRSLDLNVKLVACLISCQQDCHLFIQLLRVNSVLYDCAVGVFHSAACGRYIDASSHLFDIHYDIPHRVSNMGRTYTFQKSLKVGMDRIIYRRAYSSYICIENCRGEYNTIYYYMHACMIPICLGTSYQVHSYLFSFFMRESFSSCSCTFSSCTATHFADDLSTMKI